MGVRLVDIPHHGQLVRARAGAGSCNVTKITRFLATIAIFISVRGETLDDLRFLTPKIYRTQENQRKLPRRWRLRLRRSSTAHTNIVDCAYDGRRLRLRRSSTALTTVGMRKMEEWKGARAGRRGIRDVSNERAETRLIEKSLTDEEIAAIAQKHKIGV